MKKIKRIFNIFCDFVKSSFCKVFFKKPKVMSDEQTINYILNNKCSIARFGDGELSLMNGRSIGFQRVNKEITAKLKEIKTNDKCLVCIPSIFDKKTFNKNDITKSEYSWWARYNTIFGGLWNYRFKGNKVLGDAFISRFYLRKENKSIVKDYISKLKLLWENRDIVFVEGEKSRLGVDNDLFENSKSVRRILCPSKDAFQKYDEIKLAIEEFCNPTDLVILAIGPTATILAYELSDKFQCLDLGHIDIEYEWFKMGATEKVAISSKYVNEVEDGRNPEDVNDDDYKNQIIKVIDL